MSIYGPRTMLTWTLKFTISSLLRSYPRRIPFWLECPPFWVLLDHTIAVTWKLFCANADRKDLGIIPLQWSREFVSAMRDERGEYLPATGQLLGAIEDALIDRYAKAADANDCEETGEDDTEAGTCKKSKGDCKKEQDSLSYVSSESIFKYPVEVSYTLKDIMSRNMPGRKHAEGDDSVRGIEDPAVSKIDVPPPEDHETMSKSDMLDYLKQLKQEQELRVEKEKEHAQKIEALMELLARGKTRNDPFEGYDSKKKKEHDAEHVHFDEDEEDTMKHEKSDTDKGEGGKGGKGKGGKEKGKEKEGKKNEEVKKEKSEDDQKKKKKVVSMG
uniref:Uncharacterized protein n=1 Tax=Lygus hesperus TaxID=30085 RepID=A0A0A9X2E4_LYGHE